MKQGLIVVGWMGLCFILGPSCRRPVTLVQRSDGAYSTYSTTQRAALLAGSSTDSPGFVAKVSKPGVADSMLPGKASPIDFPVITSLTRRSKQPKASLTADFVDGINQKTDDSPPIPMVSQLAWSDPLKLQPATASPQQPMVRRKFLNVAMLFLIVGFLVFFFSKGGLRILGISLQVIGIVFIILGIKLK